MILCIYHNVQCHVTGQFPDVPHYVALPGITVEECKKQGYKVDQSQVCAHAGDEGKDSCQVDRYY